MMVFRPNTRIVSQRMSGLFAILLASACAIAEYEASPPAQTTALASQPSAGPALWRAFDEDTTIYIFGAAELIPPDIEWESDAFTSSFVSADIIILETDDRVAAQAGLGALIQELGIYTDGRTLLDILSEEQQMEINAVSTALGAPLPALAQLKPWLASIQIGALHAVKQGYQNWPSGLLDLAQKAEAMEKPIRFFEDTRGDLLRVMAGLPEQTHIKMLVNTARQVRDKPTQAAEIVPIWAAGDVEELAVRYHGEGQWADEVLYDALLIQRNLDWVQRIKMLLGDEEGVIFIGVGSGHLVGPDSLITMLEQHGVVAVRQ